MTGSGLSTHGESRRELMLEDMLGAVRQRGRRRRAIRVSASVLPLVVLAAVALIIAPKGQTGDSGVELVASGEPVALEQRLRHVSFERIGTEPRDVRYVASSASAEKIDDRELIRLLREAGRTGGLIRRGDELILTGDLTEIEESGPASDAQPGSDERDAA